jgi:hypothetical protein
MTLQEVNGFFVKPEEERNMTHQSMRKMFLGKYGWIGFFGTLFLWVLVGASASGNGALSLEGRVACQRAIEEVYWRHTIWPEENTSPKPPLHEVMSADELRQKVEETLRMSRALAEVWQHPITGSALQGEMERMAETTRHPDRRR